ncbi:MAG: ribokinase, partial [Promethearchaeota archaeon]
MNVKHFPKNYTLIIGSSNMDLIIYSERLPKPGETVTGGRFEQHLGGKGANQSVASARSGSKTYFIGKIGEDEYGNHMISQLKRENVETDYIMRDQTPSGIAFIMVDKNGENMISVAPGANALLNPQEIEKRKELIMKASSLVVQMEIPTETIVKIFEIASEGKVIKILNPAPLKELPKQVFTNIDIIIPNEGELYQMHKLQNLGELKEEGNDKIIKASQNIINLGVDTVITTLGSKGCFVHNQTKVLSKSFPAYKVRAIDTVGAGDCFNGV